MSVSAGPPLGGLYLKPPSSGGLWEGVTTMPSARWSRRSRFQMRMAWERAGVGVGRSAESTRTWTPWATSTSRAVRWAGLDRAWVSRPMYNGPSIPLA